MAWRKKPKTVSSQASDAVTVKNDEKSAQLEAALAKIKYPTPLEKIVGTVVQSGGQAKQEPSSAKASLESSVSKTAAISALDASKDSKSEPAQAPPEESGASGSQPSLPTPQTEVTHTVPGTDPTTEPKGPLSTKELHALGKFLKQKQQKQDTHTGQQFVAPTIAPTNPDPDATIAQHISEKQKAQEKLAAEEEAKKWHVTQARIVEQKLDTKKVKEMITYWLGSLALSIVLYVLAHAFHADSAGGFVQVLVMVPIYLLALYGVAGWIPLMLLYMRNRKD